MPESVNISVNGQSKVPPGFRFHPTEEELLQYYLKKKVSYEQIDLDVIQDVDLNKLEPWDIQENCKIGSTPQNDWYFFSHKDKKYPTGTRTNRATVAGFWKATGRDKVIYSNASRIGMRKTLVFYKGRAPHGHKSDWIMHEYRLDDNINTSCINSNNVSNNAMGDATQEEGWVVCRIFKKKNHYKTIDSPISATTSATTTETTTQRLFSNNEGTLEQILQCMGRSNCENENESFFLRPIDTATDNSPHDRYMNLPNLRSPNATSSQAYYQPGHVQMLTDNPNLVNYHSETSWAALDPLAAASNLNAQNETSINRCELQLQQLQSFNRLHQDYNSEFDLWNSARSSLSYNNDPPCHM